MYCPKCKDVFEEGSRRFCPTDGSRLISEAARANARSGGIFASLIPKIDAISDLDEKVQRPTRLSEDELSEPAIAEPELGIPFFELDDPDLEIPPPIQKPLPEAVEIPAAPPVAAEAETRPLGRKVQPFEIPAGHVDLGGVNRFPSPAQDFSLEDPERFVGRTVKGRYVVSEFLGGDENGLAYLADDRLAKDRKVLVRILVENDYDEIMTSILGEERVSLSHFSHPNVARLIDSGSFSNGLNFLVSEYFDALSVDDLLAIHSVFEPQRAVRSIRQAANALNEAHQEGIIHRDIRPSNLIVDASNTTEQVKVVNFGASNGEPNEHNMAYKAPEVLEGRIATVASDIFSLGAVAFEMLTGQLPFDGGSAKELLKQQSSGLPRSASSINTNLPRSVDEVLERALALNAADRFTKAREFGDNLYAAITDPPKAIPVPVERPSQPVEPVPAREAKVPTIISLEPAVKEKPAPVPALPKEEPNWKSRSPEPPETGSFKRVLVAGLGVLALVIVAATAWYFSTRNVDVSTPPTGDPVNTNIAQEVTPSSEMPPLPRNIPQPPNTSLFQSSKDSLRGDLLRNFVGFSLYYPTEWKLNGPQNGSSPNSRGKFLDISRSGPDGRMQEQMLISYYPSRGTFDSDDERFPQLVKETNDTLKKLLPEYQMVSEGEIRINQEWRAYEVKFQGGGTSPSGEKLVVWGRRVFVPAARPGARNGFEITMLATSLSDTVRSVDDVGVKGELASVLATFEPRQDF